MFYFYQTKGPSLLMDGRNTNAHAVSITDVIVANQPCFQEGNQECSSGLSISAFIRFVTPDIKGNLLIETMPVARKNLVY